MQKFSENSIFSFYTCIGLIYSYVFFLYDVSFPLYLLIFISLMHEMHENLSE